MINRTYAKEQETSHRNRDTQELHLIKASIYRTMCSEELTKFNELLQAKDKGANTMAYAMINNSLDIDKLSEEDICLLSLSLDNSNDTSEQYYELRKKVGKRIDRIPFLRRSMIIDKVYKANYNN